jgi:hypothetical protein
MRAHGKNLDKLQKLLRTNRAILTQFLKKPINDE